MLIMPMIFVLLYTFHCEFPQAAEKALSAVGRLYKVRWGRHVRPSAWVNHWSHLHKRAGGPWRVIGCSGHRRHIALLKEWGGRLIPRAKGQTSSGRESATGSLTATWARGCPFHETFTFPGWHMRIICGCQLDCLGPTLSSTGRGMEGGCTERGSFWAMQNLLPALMVCVPTKYGMQAVRVLQEGTKKPFHNHHGHLKGEFSGFPPPISYQAL